MPRNVQFSTDASVGETDREAEIALVNTTANDDGSPEIRCDGGTRVDETPEERVEEMPDENPDENPTTEFFNADTCPICSKTVEIHVVYGGYPNGSIIGQYATACSEERTPKRFDGVDEEYEQRQIVKCPYCNEDIAICQIRESDPHWTGGWLGYALAEPNLRETDGFRFAVDELGSFARHTTPSQTFDYWIMEKTRGWDTKRDWADHRGVDRSTVSRNVTNAEDDLPEALHATEDDFGTERDRPIRHDDGVLTADDVREIGDDQAVYVLDNDEESVICAFFPDDETDMIWWASPSGRSSKYIDDQVRSVVAHSPTKIGDRAPLLERLD